jgi:hypothetical protein
MTSTTELVDTCGTILDNATAAAAAAPLPRVAPCAPRRPEFKTGTGTANK